MLILRARAQPPQGTAPQGTAPQGTPGGRSRAKERVASSHSRDHPFLVSPPEKLGSLGFLTTYSTSSEIGISLILLS